MWLTLAIGMLSLLQSAGSADFRRGLDLFQAGNVAQSIPHLEQALRAEPENALYLKSLGVAHAALSQYELAEPCFARACKLKPGLENACYYHGRALYALNRFEPSIAALEKALGATPQTWKVHLGLGQAMEAIGRDRDAEDHFKRAMRGSPAQFRNNEEDPRIHYGVFLFRQGRLQDALALFRQAVTASPSAPRAQYELGRVLYHTGNDEEAAAALKAAVALEPSYAAAHWVLGKVYRRMGRIEDAERHLAAGREGAQ